MNCDRDNPVVGIGHPDVILNYEKLQADSGQKES